MNLTLATCALGTLGLTPVLFKTQGSPQDPPTPIRATSSLAFSPPVAPAAPPRLYVSDLASQSGTQDLERDAEKLQDEIKRLRNELKALQKVMRKSKNKASSKERQSEIAKLEAVRRQFESQRSIVEEQRERMFALREKTEEQAAQLAEEARALTSRLAGETRSTALLKQKRQDGKTKPQIVVGKSTDGKNVEWSTNKDNIGRVILSDGKKIFWSGDEDGDEDVRVFVPDDKKGGKQTLSLIHI